MILLIQTVYFVTYRLTNKLFKFYEFYLRFYLKCFQTDSYYHSPIHTFVDRKLHINNKLVKIRRHQGFSILIVEMVE